MHVVLFDAISWRRGLHKTDETSPQPLFLCSYLDTLYNEFFNWRVHFLLTAEGCPPMIISPQETFVWIHLPLWTEGFSKRL